MSRAAGKLKLRLRSTDDAEPRLGSLDAGRPPLAALPDELGRFVELEEAPELPLEWLEGLDEPEEVLELPEGWVFEPPEDWVEPPDELVGGAESS